MKLKGTDWKHAWFESHISERFFQELARLEKGAVQGLETSAQWTEQIMVEVGALAQAMIRLEHDGAPEPQIRQAYEKAMRLAALSLHLITALDGADRLQIRSASIVRSEHEPYRAPAPTPAPAAAPERPAPAAPKPPAATPQAGPAVAAPGLLMRSPVPLHRAQTDPRAERVEAASSVAGAGEPEAGTPLFTSLLQVAGRTAHSESALHQTIVSLSQQGLSRAEIEMVTGEPRHVIEAVLNHARTRPQAAAPTR